MKCPKCGSENVTVNIVTDVKSKYGHGALWWICIGWWWIPVKWLFLTFPALIVKLFGSKKQKIVSTQKTMCACQSCGHTWTIKK